MQFSNRLNVPHKLPSGEILWDSRSCAVTTVVSAQHDGDLYIAMNKRGPGTPDFQGSWSLSCGYIDWDEDAYDAARREIWEEIGLDVEKEGFQCLGGVHERQPWFVQSNPRASNQNISLRFWFTSPGEVNELPQLSADNCEPNEVDDVRWWKVEDALELELAFDQNTMIKMWRDNHANSVSF